MMLNIILRKLPSRHGEISVMRKIKKSPKYPKIKIMTDCYRVFFIRLSPFTVAFHSKNDLIIEMFYS